MLKNERTFTTTYTGGAPNGIAILHTDGSLTVQPDRGQRLVIEGLARAVLEEHTAYLAWREAQGGTPGKLSTVKKFRKKEVVVEALQLRWDTWGAMCEFTDVGPEYDKAYAVYVDADGNVTEDTNARLGLKLHTVDGFLLAVQDDWIIRDAQGGFHLCAPDVFAETYEQAIEA